MSFHATEYTNALITAMVCSLAAFLLCWLWHVAAQELRTRGVVKVVLFIALATPLALWSVGKGSSGGDSGGGTRMGPPGAPNGIAALPDPPLGNPSAPTNLQFTAFATFDGYLSYALAWPSTALLPGNVVDVYATHDLVHGLWYIVDTFTATGSEAYTNSLDVGEVQEPDVPSLFLCATDRTDEDGDGFPDAWASRLHRLDSDGDGTPDFVEAGCAEVLPEEEFLWFDLNSPWNGISGSYYWTNISANSLLGGVPRNFVQHCRDGFLNLVPDVNWPQGQIDVWSAADSLFTNDYSCGGVTVMAMPASLTGLAAYGSGLFSDSVVTNGCVYDVFLWKDVWPSAQPAATAPRATFEVILPAAEPDTVYVSYLSVDEGFPGPGRRFGVQDASRRSAADPACFHVVSRLGTAGFPRARQTVKYTLGLNADPHADDGYVEPDLPSTADTNAYFTVRVVAGASSVRVAFTGDGPSYLPDPQFLLGAGQETRVLLLKGKSYSVAATGAVVCSDPSDPDAEIACADADGKSWQVERPVVFALVDEAGSTAAPRVAVDPAGFGCAFSWTGVCRPELDAAGVWRLACSACGCGRCRVTGLAAWEGYTKAIDLGFCRCLPEGDDVQTVIMCPDTLFNNDDSDRVTNSVDSALAASTGPHDNPLADDDIVPVTVTFGVSHARGSALLSASGGKLRFWTSKDKRQECHLPLWIDDVELPHTVELWMEATDVSDAYEDQSLALVWQSASGRHSGSLSKSITCVEPVVEPVCAEEKTVLEDKFIYNPSCLVNDGRPAYFKASWTPADYPASRVSWSSDNAQVHFIGGSTGAEVCAWTSGSAGAYARLSLQFGDCPSARPSFGTHVVDNRVVRIYVVPVMVSESGDYTGLGYEDYESVISTYAQIGIMPYFVQEQPIVCTALSQSRHDSASVRKCLRGTFTATNGKVVYVLPFRLSGCAGFAFDVGGRELAVGLNRHRKTLAHELGHALGLFDIYTNLGVERPLLGLSMKLETKTSAARFEDSVDWNGGSGTRYYTSSCQHSELVKRHLMYGVTSDMRGDITSDSIWAISYQTTFQDNIAERFAPTGVCEMQIGENDLVDL